MFKRVAPGGGAPEDFAVVLCGKILDPVVEGSTHDTVPGFNDQKGRCPDNLRLLIFKSHLLAVAVLTHGATMVVLTGREIVFPCC